jgi:hypothetical protein
MHRTDVSKANGAYPATVEDTIKSEGIDMSRDKIGPSGMFFDVDLSAAAVRLANVRQK